MKVENAYLIGLASSLSAYLLLISDFGCVGQLMLIIMMLCINAPELNTRITDKKREQKYCICVFKVEKVILLWKI